ncbi:hypothetical protein tb265_02210 [Gemmatimonadetes bacterium T265]|nr:hypothetical protein tb265_02210 [Gemmatimonadetes bacterium T265]
MPARLEVGVAIGATSVVASTWRRAIDPPRDDGEWPALADALQALRELHAPSPSAVGELSIALLPPLAQVRPVALPPLPAAELRQLVARNAGRYFLGARGPQVIGLAPGPRARSGAMPNESSEAAPGAAPNVMAAAVDARRLDAVEGAARRAGWRVCTVVPAESAWRAAAVASWPELAAGAHQVGVVHDERLDVLGLYDGRLAAVRRFPLAAGIDGAGVQTPDGALRVLGAPALRDVLCGAPHGAPVQPPAAPWLREADAAELAATFVARGVGLELVPEYAWRESRRRRWRTTATVAGAAALLLLVAGVLQVAALERQLRAVRAERARVRARVAGVLAAEALAASAGRQLTELAAAPGQSPRWAVVLETLSAHLPASAYLTAVTGHTDTLVVEGNADESGAVFDGLSGSPMLADVRTAAPVRREFRDGEAAAEHFTLAARVLGVRRPPAVPAAGVAARARP